MDIKHIYISPTWITVESDAQKLLKRTDSHPLLQSTVKA